MTTELRVHTAEGIRAASRARGHKLPHGTLTEPIQRLITTSDGIATLTQKIVLDVNQGREEVPLLYPPLYSYLGNDDLPRNVSTNILQAGQVVFLQRFEAGEVQFGTMAKGTAGTVTIVNYAAGFEYTRETVMYNEGWSLEILNRAFGEAYNALLNHIHLGAFVSFAYAAGNTTAAATQAEADAAFGTGSTVLERTRLTLLNAVRTSANARNPRRPGSILLASLADRYQIEDALNGQVNRTGNALPRIADITDIILYDGWDGSVGDKPYSYPGVAGKTCYLIQPKRRLFEIVKTQGGRDLVIEAGNADLSRRIENQFVAFTDRTIYADIAGSTQKILLP